MLRTGLWILTTFLAAAAQAQVVPPALPVLPRQDVVEDPFQGRLLTLEAFAEEAGTAHKPSASEVTVLRRVTPFYPYRLERAEAPGEEPRFEPKRDAGRAEVVVLVGKDGKPRRVAVRQATRDSFGLASAEAVLQFEFEPVQVDGSPVDFQIVVPFTFTPETKPSEPEARPDDPVRP